MNGESDESAESDESEERLMVFGMDAIVSGIVIRELISVEKFWG